TYPDNRYLHYFTTRRSSDLLYAIIMNAGKEYAKQFDQEPFVQEITEGSSLLRNYSSVIESLTPKSHKYYSYTRVNSGSGSSGGSDRKSTRLNSSHVSIPYAV